MRRQRCSSREQCPPCCSWGFHHSSPQYFFNMPFPTPRLVPGSGWAFGFQIRLWLFIAARPGLQGCDGKAGIMREKIMSQQQTDQTGPRSALNSQFQGSPVVESGSGESFDDVANVVARRMFDATQHLRGQCCVRGLSGPVMAAAAA